MFFNFDSKLYFPFWEKIKTGHDNFFYFWNETFKIQFSCSRFFKFIKTVFSFCTNFTFLKFQKFQKWNFENSIFVFSIISNLSRLYFLPVFFCISLTMSSYAASNCNAMDENLLTFYFSIFLWILKPILWLSYLRLSIILD